MQQLQNKCAVHKNRSYVYDKIM